MGRNEDPREAFTNDLARELEKWREKGFEIVVGVDANEDLTAGALYHSDNG